MSDKRYFAQLQGEELLFELNKRIQEYAMFLESSGRLRKMRLQYQHYYGTDGAHSSMEVTAGGEQGELDLLKVNTLRNLLQHLLVLITSNRPTIDCKAANNDAKSREQAILGNSLIEYYLRQKGIEKAYHNATEVALCLDEGFVAFEWDFSLGEELAVDANAGMPVKDGDIKATVLTPLEHIINPYQRSANAQWRILKLKENRWDLAAKYPELNEQIIQLEKSQDVSQFYYLAPNSDLNEDLIDVYLFYHEKTAAVPEGRAVLFAEDIQFYDVPLPYDRVPVVRISPSDQINTPFGYSVSGDLLALQQLRDGLNSIIATNNIRFGTQNIIGPKGADINVQQLGRGMTYLEVDPKYVDSIKPLQLTKTAPETYSYDDKIDTEMEKLSGVNSVSRGVPPSADMSGTAMALLQFMAIQFNSGLQESFHRLLERGGDVMLDMLKRYVKTPKVAAIVGANDRYMIKSFVGDDLSQVQRVICESGNPLSRTLSGRVSMAQDLLQNGMIKRPQEYFNLLQTGRIEPMFDNEAKASIQIQAENEALLNGAPVKAMISDDPRLHIQDHLSLLDGNREDAQLVSRVLAHVQDHIQVEASADPVILQILGRQPLVMPQPPMGPQGPGAPSQPAPQNLAAESPVQQQANEVQQPSLPTNPMTGNQFDPQTGGL
jgi:hypothetical protein